MIKFNKGELKALYDYNQEMKNIFQTYIFKNQDYCFGSSKFIGIHYAESSPSVLGDDAKMIYSKDLFDTIKTGRKDIKEYDIIKNTIRIKDKIIGEYIDDSFLNELYKHHNSYIEEYNLSNHIYKLNEDELYDLVKNKVVPVGIDDYSVRISNKLIPGLKKSHIVIIRFYDDHITNHKKLFFMDICVDRTVVKTHHIYQCVKM